VRVNDAQGQATVADVIAGLEWIYTNSATYNIRVVNMSLNSNIVESYHDSALDAAVELLWFKGIVVVVSAGNNGDDGKLYPPANDPFVITVGATDDKGTPSALDDKIAPFSARGTTEAGTSKPEIMAPGVNIVSLMCAGCTMNTTYAQYKASGFTGADRYFRASGTSMSAAIVSGAVALMLQRTPSLDPDQVKQILISTGWNGPFNYSDPRYLQIAWAVTSAPVGRANTGILVSRAIDLVGNKKDLVWDSAKMGWGSAKMGWGSALWTSSTLSTSMTHTMSTMSVNWQRR
jgi:serine protease AprX